MATTTAKELRENLASIRKRVMAGESIDVIYRSRPVMRISPIGTSEKKSQFTGEEVGKKVDALIKDLPQSISPMMRDSDKTYKQLRDELYRRDPKYRRYLSKKSIDA